MSMQDPIADMLTRIRNAQAVAKKHVAIPKSTLKEAILTIFKEEGYIEDYRVEKGSVQPSSLVVDLKYYEGRPVIVDMKMVSSPGLRVYKSTDELEKVKNGLGIAVISTSKGIMSDRQARRLGLGGEVICYVS